MARSPLQAQMATPVPAQAVGNSALENEVRNMSQAIQQLSGHLGNMNQSLSSRMDLMHAGMEHNSRILGEMMSSTSHRGYCGEQATRVRNKARHSKEEWLTNSKGKVCRKAYSGI